MDRRGLARLPPPCAEFPNDNPLLHRGAIWACLEPCAAATCEPPLPEASVPETSVPEAPPPALDPATDPVPPVLEADDPLDDLDLDDGIEVVDELSFEEAIDESPEAPMFVSDMESVPAAADDPFAILVRVLEEVAAASGANEDALNMLRMLLGSTRLDASAPADAKALRDQALAWQGILRGESEDFDALGGTMLDDWSAALVARVLGNSSRTDGLKRELRKRGVAAFGIVEQAA